MITRDKDRVAENASNVQNTVLCSSLLLFILDLQKHTESLKVLNVIFCLKFNIALSYFSNLVGFIWLSCNSELRMKLVYF